MPGGPVAILGMRAMLAQIVKSAEDFEIRDHRLQELLEGARLTRLPTNSELGIPARDAVYPVQAFPEWSICTMHQLLYRNSCNRCQERGAEAFRKARREAVRFLLACEHGHVDDLDWRWAIHRNAKKPCDYQGPFEWVGGGRSLANIELRCPGCKHRQSFGEIYSRAWKCSGRRIEDAGAARPWDCASNAELIQRNASNLRMPDHVDALTILSTPRPVFEVLNRAKITGLARRWVRRVDNGESPIARADLEDMLEDAEASPSSTAIVLDEHSTDPEGLTRSIRELYDTQPVSGESLLTAELDFLLRAAQFGAPPTASVRPGAPPLFEAPLDEIKTITRSGATVRVTPVTRLRVVMAQRGYRRLSPDGPMTSVSFIDHGDTWYPALELFGEGLFIDLADRTHTLRGPAAERAMDRWIAHDRAAEWHPAHVWWHTLSHRLLQAVGIDSGYSSSAIRERIYVSLEPDDTHSGVPRQSGILLYTVQPGGDGTLGGLTALASRWGDILDIAMDGVPICSNDPLCGDQSTHGDGAYCYSCLLASETSCPKYNAGLDRLLLLENPI